MWKSSKSWMKTGDFVLELILYVTEALIGIAFINNGNISTHA